MATTSLDKLLTHKLQKLKTPIDFLDYFPMYDWITSMELLNRDFQRWVKQKCDQTTTLDLSQLWSIVGDEFIEQIQILIKRFPVATNVSLAYCHNVTDDLLTQFLGELCVDPLNIQELNLFYNNKLTDISFQWICKQFPNLVVLNVGRCMNIADKSIDKISNLQKLKKLTISSTELGTEAILLLEENGCLEQLTFLDITGCKNIGRDELQECLPKFPKLELKTDVTGITRKNRKKNRAKNGA